jgi:hypothetical protein
MRTAARRTWLFAVVCAAALIAGCVTPVQVVSLRPPTERAPAADEGVLAISFTVNTGSVGQFDTLVLKREGDPDPKTAGAQYEYSVPELTGRVARDTSLFVASLKEGNYSIVRLYDSDMRMTFTPGEKNKTLGSFRIVPGKLTDLGRAVITPINFEIAVGRSTLLKNNDALLSRFAPSTKNFYKEVLPQGWNTPRHERDFMESFALTHPVGISTIVELKDGRVAAATRLGTILLREPNGRWRPLRTGTLDAWIGVAPASAPDAILVAVGEYSNIAKVDADGKFHPVDRGNLPIGTLIFVAGDSAHGWVVAHRLNDKFTLYRTDSLENPQWTPVLTDTLKISFWSGAQQLWLWQTKDGFGYGRSTGEIRFYNMATRGWTDRISPEKKTVLAMVASPGGLGIITSPGGGLGGVTATTWISKDDAQTWEEAGTPYKVKVYPPKVTASGIMLQSGGVFGKDTLQGSKDLGKTWYLLSDKVALADAILPLPTAGVFKLDNAGLNGGRSLEIISHSADDGATWNREYSSLDVELLRMQLEKDKADKAPKESAPAETTN